MMVRENIRMAIASLSGSRLRTFLSLLGIMIGVASVVAILNLGRSVTESMSSSFEVGGLDTISVMPRGSARETMIFTEEFAYSLQNEIDGIREILPVVSSAANVRNGQEISRELNSLFAQAKDTPEYNAIEMLSLRTMAEQYLSCGCTPLSTQTLPTGGSSAAYTFPNSTRPSPTSRAENWWTGQCW